MLCDQFGIISVSDRIQICHRTSKGPAGQLLRVIGSYDHESMNERKPATLFVGSSCGRAIRSENEGGADTAWKYRGNSLRRPAREWVPGSKKFAAGLQRATLIPGTLIDPYAKGNEDVDYRQFMIKLRRGEEPNRKKVEECLRPRESYWKVVFDNASSYSRRGFVV